jgi:hypothetical protein
MLANAGIFLVTMLITATGVGATTRIGSGILLIFTITKRLKKFQINYKNYFMNNVRKLYYI